MNSDELNTKIQTVASDAAEYMPIEEPITGPVLLNMADVQAKSVSWLWRHRIAQGRLSLLVGRAGLGKSFCTLDMAARITTGRNWPDGASCEAGSVLLICCEDDPGDTIRVRLDAARADVHKIELLKAVQIIDPETDLPREIPFILKDVLAMEAALGSMPDCRLVIIDPIGSYLGGRTDAHRDNEVRSVLAPVAALAEKYGPAVLIVAHTRKSSATYADDTVLGSRGFTGIVRSSWHLMSDEQDPDRRLLLPGKSNLSKTAPGLAFRIEPDKTGRDETTCVVWEDLLIDMHADDAMAIANESTKPGPQPEKRNEAAVWLAEQLADGLPKAVQDIRDEAKAAGLAVSPKTLGRALDSLGGIREKAGAVWQWRIPKPMDKSPSRIDSPNLRENNLSSCPVDKTPENTGLNEAEIPSGQVDKFSPSGRSPSHCGKLDPEKPGPVDLLNDEQHEKYKAIYYSRPASMSPEEKHRRAWRAAVTGKAQVPERGRK